MPPSIGAAAHLRAQHERPARSFRTWVKRGRRGRQRTTSTNGVRSTVSQEAVQEFQIITNNYSAEYGRAARRSGETSLRGQARTHFPRRRVWLFAQPEFFQAVNSVQHRSESCLHASASGSGLFRRSDQEGTRRITTFSYEITRRHETGFSSIGQGNFGLTPFDTTGSRPSLRKPCS